MKYNEILKAGLKLSGVTLGTWVFGGDNWGGAREQESVDAVKAAVDCGINTIDTAPIYGYGIAETAVGKAIKGKRDKVILATKCGLVGRGKNITTDLSPDSIRNEIKDSLRRLQTDYVDIYQCHWPDPKTPVEKTMETLCQLKSQGKIKHIGISNFDAELLKKASSYTTITTLQNQYSMLERSLEKSILPFCREKGIGIISYGPLAGGILTGKYATEPQLKNSDARSFFYKHYKGEAFQKVQELLEILKSFNRPLNQVAINWVRQQKGITSVIVGCRNAQQVLQNAAACDWDLSPQEMKKIEDALKHF